MGRPIGRPTGARNLVVLAYTRAVRPIGRPADGPTARPVAGPADQPVDRPAGRPADRWTSRPTELLKFIAKA